MNEHALYIERTWPGGLAGYVAAQQARWKAARRENDYAMIVRLRADMARVGYSLTDPAWVHIPEQARVGDTAPVSWPVARYPVGTVEERFARDVLYAADPGAGARGDPLVALAGAPAAVGRSVGGLLAGAGALGGFLSREVWPQAVRFLPWVVVVLLAGAFARVFRIRLRLGR